MPDVIKRPLRMAGGFLEEFKGFALKGNLVDLAVGVVIGTAFTGVVNALVAHIFMPLLSYVTPNQNYRHWMIGKIEVGAFITALINFLIVALAVFVVIQKIIGYLVRKRLADGNAAAAPKAVPEDIQLLTEIRDLLKRQQDQQKAQPPTPTTPPFGGGVAGDVDRGTNPF